MTPTGSLQQLSRRQEPPKSSKNIGDLSNIQFAQKPQSDGNIYPHPHPSNNLNLNVNDSIKQDSDPRIEVAHNELELLQSKNRQLSLSKAWKNHGLIIIAYVKKFIFHLKLHCLNSRFKNLSQKQFSIINDQSSNYNYYFYRKLFVANTPTKLQLKLNYLSTEIKRYQPIKLLANFFDYAIIYPDKGFTLVWQAIQWVLLLYHTIFIPLNICFDLFEKLSDTGIILFFWSTTVFLMLDIILNFFTAFYDKGIVRRTNAPKRARDSSASHFISQ